MANQGQTDKVWKMCPCVLTRKHLCAGLVSESTNRSVEEQCDLVSISLSLKTSVGFVFLKELLLTFSIIIFCDSIGLLFIVGLTI